MPRKTLAHISVRLDTDLLAWVLTQAEGMACSQSEAIRIHLTRARQADREAQALAARDERLGRKGA